MMKMYVRFSDLFGKKVAIPTLKKMLRQFKRSDVIYRLAMINTLLALRNDDDEADTHRHLADSFLDNEIVDRVEQMFGNNQSSRFISVFQRQVILYLLRLCILECSEDAELLATGGTSGGYELGRCILIANDYLLSKKEEEAISQGSVTKKRHHWNLQLSPILEFYNPPRADYAIVRSEKIYSDILNSPELNQRLSGGLAGFDIAKEFLDATEITLEQFREFTLGIYCMLVQERKPFFLNPLLCLLNLVLSRKILESISRMRRKTLPGSKEPSEKKLR